MKATDLEIAAAACGDGLFGSGEEREYASLYDYLTEVREVVEGGIPEARWISAEIASVSNGWPDRHCYMELAETDGAGRKIADVRAVIWRNVNNALTPIFRESTGGDLRAGIKVLVKVRPRYSEVYGFSLNILDIEPSFTLGDMEAQRRRTMARLEYEGLVDLNRELAIPSLPCRLAVVSSEQAAGYGDFIKHIGDSGISFRVELFPAPMQGETAPAGISEAFSRIAARQDEFDVIVFIRGGGSTLDLACFDDYLVAKTIAGAPLPVISGIGHERDTHICDMVAAVRVKTPTGAADYLIGMFGEGKETLSDLQRRLSEAASKAVEEGGRSLNSLVSRMGGSVAARIGEGLLSVQRVENRLFSAANAALAGEDMRLERSLGRLRSLLYGAVSDNIAKLEGMSVRMYNAALAKIHLESSKLDLLGAKLGAADPARILDKGYGLIYSDGRQVTAITQIAEGSSVRILMKDGDATFIAKDVKNSF